MHVQLMYCWTTHGKARCQYRWHDCHGRVPGVFFDSMAALSSNEMLPKAGTEQPLLTSNSKKRVGDAATERCRFSVLEGVRETTDGERAATGVSAKAATAVNLVAPTS